MSNNKQSAFYIIGISVDTSTNPSKISSDLHMVWDRFMKENIADKIPGKLNQDIVCVYDNYKQEEPGMFSLRATVGCKVDASESVPDNMIKVKTEAGNYEQVRVTGKMPDAIMEAWENISKNRQDLDRTFQTDYELYTEAFNDPKNPEMSIFLGVK